MFDNGFWGIQANKKEGLGLINLKVILICMGINFRKWSSNARIYTLAALTITFLLWLLSGLSQYVSAIDVSITPWVFPHILSNPTVIMVYGCFVTLLFCDAPFIDKYMPFVVIRSGRLNWLLGQLMYIILSGLIFTMLFFVVSLIALIPNLSFSLEWGTVLKTLSINPEAAFDYRVMIFVNENIIRMFSPLKALFISLGLFWLVSVFIGVLIFCFNGVIRKMSGLVAAGTLVFISYFSVYLGSLLFGIGIYYFSPLSWSSISYLDWNYTGSFPSPTYAVLFLVGAIFLMSIVSLIVLCKKDINVQERGY